MNIAKIKSALEDHESFANGIVRLSGCWAEIHRLRVSKAGIATYDVKLVMDEGDHIERFRDCKKDVSQFAGFEVNS